MDFVTTIWANFRGVILSQLDPSTRDAIERNKDIEEIGEEDAEKMMTAVLDKMYSKLFYIFYIQSSQYNCTLQQKL